MNFKHASASRSQASSVVCIARGDDGVTGFGEGCPRDYVTHETVETVAAFFRASRQDIEKTVQDLATLRRWIDENRSAIDANPAAFSAIEIALIDLFARRADQSIEDFLDLPKRNRLPVSSVMGASGTATTALLATGYRFFGMTDAKIKLSNDVRADRKRIAIVSRILGPSMRLRVDANNLFRDVGSCAAHLHEVGANIWAIEEPLQPGHESGQHELATATGLQIILDESALQPKDLLDLDGDRWIVNLRISKLGGLLRSLDMLKAARSSGFDVIIGSHVGETSLLARCALPLAAACGDRLIATECGYGGYLLKHDLSRPSLRFGRDGVLDIERTRMFDLPGLGLNVDETLLTPIEADRP